MTGNERKGGTRIFHGYLRRVKAAQLLLQYMGILLTEPTRDLPQEIQAGVIL